MIDCVTWVSQSLAWARQIRGLGRSEIFRRAEKENWHRGAVEFESVSARLAPHNTHGCVPIVFPVNSDEKR